MTVAPAWKARPSSGRRSVGFLDLAAEGCALDGVADDTAAFQAAYTKARQQGKQLVFTGKLRLTNGLQKSGQAGGWPVQLRGDGPDNSELQIDFPAGASVTTALDLGGYGSLFVGAVALTADAVKGTRTLTVGDTSGFAVGDVLRLRSETAWAPSDKGAKLGELVRVGSKTATTITLTRPIEDTYTVAATGTVGKAQTSSGSLLEGFAVRNLHPRTQVNAGFRLAGHLSPTLKDLAFYGIDGMCVMLEQCEDPIVERLRFYDITDDPTNGRYGYGVIAYGATRGGRMLDSFMRNGRHLFTTGSDGGTYGIPRHFLVANCEATEMDNAGIDSHVEGEYIHFENCHVYGNRAWGIAQRAPNSTVRGCTVTDCVGAGVWVRGNGSEVSDCTIRRAKTGVVYSVANDPGTTYEGQGVRVADAINATGLDDVIVRGVVVEDTDGAGVYVGDGSDRFSLDAIVRRPGNGGSNGYGVNFGGNNQDAHVKSLAVDSATAAVNGPATASVKVDGLQLRNTPARSSGGVILASNLPNDEQFPGVLTPTGRGWAPGVVNMVSNQARVARFVPPRDMAITLAAIDLTVVATNDDPVEVAIYDATTLARVATSGAVTGRLGPTGTVLTGVKTVPIVANLIGGKAYFVAVTCAVSGATAAQFTAATFTSSNASALFGAGAVTRFTTVNSVAPGSLPNPLVLPASAGSANGVLIALRES